jgi:peptidoglycan/LPS O-acetylase OafA/YrhL
MCALLSLAFLMPFVKWNWLTELAMVLFYFPLIVALGAGSTLSKKLKTICQFSGKISYPLYMTLYAALWMFGNYYTTHKPAGSDLVLIVAVSALLLVGFAYLAMVFYDIPIRKYLKDRRKARVVAK